MMSTEAIRAEWRVLEGPARRFDGSAWRFDGSTVGLLDMNPPISLAHEPSTHKPPRLLPPHRPRIQMPAGMDPAAVLLHKDLGRPAGVFHGLVSHLILDDVARVEDRDVAVQLDVGVGKLDLDQLPATLDEAGRVLHRAGLGLPVVVIGTDRDELWRDDFIHALLVVVEPRHPDVFPHLLQLGTYGGRNLPGLRMSQAGIQQKGGDQTRQQEPRSHWNSRNGMLDVRMLECLDGRRFGCRDDWMMCGWIRSTPHPNIPTSSHPLSLDHRAALFPGKLLHIPWPAAALP